MPDLTPEDRDRLRELAENATPGPWLPHARYVWTSELGGIIQNWSEDANAAADMEFIAAAHTAMPALLDMLDQAEARIQAVRELHREEVVYELDSMNGTWVYGADDERVVLHRYCAECSSEDVIHAVEDQDWMEDWGYAWEVPYPCPTIRALDGEQ